MSAMSFRARVILRPRALDEVFDLALAYARTFFPALTPMLVATTLVPLALGASVLGIRMVASAFEILEASEASDFAVPFLLTVLVSSLSERVVTVYVGRHLFEAKASLREATRLGVQAGLPLLFGVMLRWSPILPLLFASDDFEVVIGWMFLLSLVTMVSCFMVYRRFHEGEVRLLERLTGRPARRRAEDLSMDRGGRNLSFHLQAALLRLLFIASAVGATQAIFAFVLQFEGVFNLLALPAAIAGYALSGPFIGLARLFDYVDARTRGEGWDIQVRFQEIAHAADPSRREDAA